MTNERSDELRRKHGHWSPHRHHHPVGSIADASLDVIECLDALDAMTAECDRLRSGLEAPAVVVPEPTHDEFMALAESSRIHGDLVDFMAGAAAYGLWLRGKVCTIPANRALGEAKPLSSAPKDRPILAFWASHDPR